MQEKTAIMDVLRDLCVPPHLKGYRYLLYAVELCIEDNGLLNRVTTELYPAIAAEYDDKATRVEKAIRHAVEVSHNRNDSKNLRKYFGRREKRVTNSEFIATIVYKLQFEKV